MVGADSVADDALRESESLDLGQILDVQHDGELPGRIGVNNLVVPFEQMPA